MSRSFLINYKNSIENLKEGKLTWKAPSNIALVKYWGKKHIQIPANPSLSFTLEKCCSITTLYYKAKTVLTDDFEFCFYFQGCKKPDFYPKIRDFFNKIEIYCPYLKNFSLRIDSSNTFPHSSGIASSASSMAALALCVMDLEKALYPEILEDYFYQKASFLARLGSGSACRSIRGNIVVWGATSSIDNSSDEFGSIFSGYVHYVFKNYRNSILLIDIGEKKVSSSIGHRLMYENPYANERFEQAHSHISDLKTILGNGDLVSFINLVESEALTLHAMMMTSKPYFILMKPNTLAVIEKIWEYRKRTKVPICFTLDAGSNVHVLYPDQVKREVREFIGKELVKFCNQESVIHDKIGDGAKRC